MQDVVQELPAQLVKQVRALAGVVTIRLDVSSAAANASAKAVFIVTVPFPRV
jgi:hypothetical protein